MPYLYYLVSYEKNTSEEISTNVYASNETDARALGAVKLKDYYSISIPAAALTVEKDEEITSETMTTT